jgi:Abnormal spindle-like microcephaly-assoc'd, ASPM-SPD-2-Hydin/Galactose oxidase, central domain
MSKTEGEIMKCKSLSTVAVSVLVLLGSAISARPLAAQSWAATGDMTVPRVSFAATLLQDGEVLIAGGSDGTSTLASAELYDPTTGAFTATGSMTVARTSHTATLLQNGEVLIAGGSSGAGPIASAELYDPTSGTFTATGSMTVARDNHTATLLQNGEVLIAGGVIGPDGQPNATASAELYDPSTGTFAPTGSMLTSREGASAVLMGDGDVLVTGGFPGGFGINFLSEAELYDPTTCIFSATGSMNTPRASFTLELLDTGKVLAAGGSETTLQGSDLSSAELYDPSTGVWTLTGSMAIAVSNRMTALLSDGKVLVAGGNLIGYLTFFSEAELYDPVAGTFTPTASMLVARFAGTAILLASGEVLVAGGENTSGVLASAELFQESAPAVSLSPASLTFSDQQLGTTSLPQSVTLTNTGGATLTISSITPSGDFAETNTCDSSVGAGGDCTISVTFTPTALGARTGAITITDNAADSPQMVTLSGTGIDTIPPVVTVAASPSTLWPPNGKMVPVTVSGTITDNGSGVNASTAAFAVADEYGQVQPSGNITLGAGGSYSFAVSLQASRNGNDLDGRQYTITVSAQDNVGNVGSASTVVTVLHDQGH